MTIKFVTFPQTKPKKLCAKLPIDKPNEPSYDVYRTKQTRTKKPRNNNKYQTQTFSKWPKTTKK